MLLRFLLPLSMLKQQPPIRVHIKENSLRARIAAFKLGSSNVAMVWGRTVLLHGVSKSDFLASSKWVRHELRHVWQAEQLGTFRFLWRYSILAIKHGYTNHPFEIDARLHEDDDSLMDRFEFITK
jgi:hypothetical protein